MDTKDSLYLNICYNIASFSKCLSRKIGALIVTPDGTIVGTGYNGPARGVPHCNSWEYWVHLASTFQTQHPILNFILNPESGLQIPLNQCPRHFLDFASGQALHLCQAAHAERNALINSAREGISTKGCIMYLSTVLPCKECAIEIVNAGITKIVCLSGEDYDKMARWILKQAGVEIVQYDSKNMRNM